MTKGIFKLTGKELIKARKLEREFLKYMQPEQAHRRARGLAVGKTERQAMGHKKEIQKLKKKGTAYKPAKKGRLEKKKEEWALYSYFDGISNQFSDSNSEILGITSYDLTKTLYKNYSFSGQKELFAIHQHMERQVQHYLKLQLVTASLNEINVEDSTEYKTSHRRFMWQLTDFGTGEIKYHLIYEKGQIIEREMWEDFDFFEFKMEIRALQRWE